jgi:hypothetical protein
MTHNLTQIAQRLKPYARPALTGVIVVTGLAALLVLETKAARYAFSTAPQGDELSPWLYALVSIVCGVAAFGLSVIASILKDDERKAVANRALAVRMIALLSLTVPIWSLAGAFAYDRQSREHEAYIASPVYEADQRLLAEGDAPAVQLRAARARMAGPSVASRGFGDVLGAAFLHLLVMFWAGAARLPNPITEAERQAMRDAEARARKNEQARKRRAKAKAKAKVQPKGSNVLAFGRKA